MSRKGKSLESTAINMRHLKPTPGSIAFDVVNTVFMVVLLLITVLPLLHVVWVSLSDSIEVSRGGFFLYPRGLNTAGYEIALRQPLLGRAYLNTIFYASAGTAFTLFMTALTAYPLSVPNFVLKKFVTIFLTITMFISGGTIPTYVLMKELGLINTVWVMIIPGAVGAYNVILFRTFFQGIGAEMRESARIDGASEPRILFQIIAPLSKPIFATIGLFTAVAKWNSWFDALIYLNDERLHPLQMILRKLLFTTSASEQMDPTMMEIMRQSRLSPENIKMATIVIATLPILLVYPFVQKYFVKGVFVGSIKG